MDPTKPILGKDYLMQISTQIQPTARTITITATTAIHIRHIVITRLRVPAPSITVLLLKNKYPTVSSR